MSNWSEHRTNIRYRLSMWLLLKFVLFPMFFIRFTFVCTLTREIDFSLLFLVKLHLLRTTVNGWQKVFPFVTSQLTSNNKVGID